MPAEWEPHEATWISWPHPGCQSFPGSYERVLPAIVEMARRIAESEILRVNVNDVEEEARVRELLGPLPPGSVEFFHIPTNEPWCRDHGPIFLKREEEPQLAAVKFDFNAWGFKLSPFEEDNLAGLRMAEAVGVPIFAKNQFVLEGGSVDVNGAGVVMTTESCLLHPNRNPRFGRGEIEKMVCECLGAEMVIWLGDGIEGDDTDGHVDDIARFVNAETVVVAVEEDPDDANYEPLQLNLARLKGVSLPNGRPLKVIGLPMPLRLIREGQRMPASYANFYITNRYVLMPAFHDPADAWAASVLKEVFPTREIVPIDCRELIWGLGAFHCLTQQQPAVLR